MWDHEMDFYAHEPSYIRHDGNIIAGRTVGTVSQMLGHTNILTTQIYAKITNEKISRDMDALTLKIGDKFKIAQ